MLTYLLIGMAIVTYFVTHPNFEVDKNTAKEAVIVAILWPVLLYMLAKDRL